MKTVYAFETHIANAYAFHVSGNLHRTRRRSITSTSSAHISTPGPSPSKHSNTLKGPTEHGNKLHYKQYNDKEPYQETDHL